MKRNVADIFAIAIGIFLLIEGIWGIFSPVVLGILTTNTIHAVIHILLGAGGIALGWTMRARGFCWFLGALLLVVGVLYFIPGTDQMVTEVLNVTDPVAYLNIVIGAISLVAASVSRTHRGEMPQTPTVA